MADRKAELDQKRAKVEAMRLERQRRDAERVKRNESAQNVAQLLESSASAIDADSILRELGIETNDNQRSNGRSGNNNPNAIECAQEAIELNSDSHNGVNQFNSATPHCEIFYRRRRPLTVSKVHSTSIAPTERLSYSKETQTTVEQILQTQRRVNIHADDVSSAAGSPRAASYFGSPRIGGVGLLSNLDWDDEFASGVLTYDDGRPLEDDDVLEVCVAGRYHRAPSVPRGYSQRQDSTTSAGHGHRGFASTLQRLDSTTSAQSTALPFSIAQAQPTTNGSNLSDEERSRVMASEAFANFVMRAARFIERTIVQDDTLVDYTVDHSAAACNMPAFDEQLITLDREFFDEKWCRNRIVTALEWHNQFPELLLTAYSASQDLAVQDCYGSSTTSGCASLPEGGVCLVWNTRFKTNTPEFVFTCPSALTAACFVRNQPNLIVGGTYSGQLVIWDNRVLRRTPVHRTPLSSAAHTHPVYCLQMVGGPSQPSQLVSVSSDGRLCVWSVEMLSRPIERLELAFDKSSKSHVATGNVSVTALSCLAHDSNSFLIGAEDGGVYFGNRHGQTQNRTGLVSCFEAHGALVSAVHSSPHSIGSAASPSCDLSHLFLTAAFDSTVRLWSLRDDRPICTLERAADYVNDVQFSPSHPGLFATVDSLGRVELWNLLRDSESPIAVHVGNPTKPEFALPSKLEVDDYRIAGVNSIVRAQSKVRWNPMGNRLATGDCSGRVQLLTLADRVAQPHVDDATRFSRLLVEMKTAQTNTNNAASSFTAHSVGLTHTQRVESPLHRSISPLKMAING